MKIPRDISAAELILLLEKYGYSISRQTGSHIRLSTNINGEHHITVPNHNPIKIGTLSSVIKDVSVHIEIDKSIILYQVAFKQTGVSVLPI